MMPIWCCASSPSSSDMIENVLIISAGSLGERVLTDRTTRMIPARTRQWFALKLYSFGRVCMQVHLLGCSRCRSLYECEQMLSALKKAIPWDAVVKVQEIISNSNYVKKMSMTCLWANFYLDKVFGTGRIVRVYRDYRLLQNFNSSRAEDEIDGTTLKLIGNRIWSKKRSYC